MKQTSGQTRMAGCKNGYFRAIQKRVFARGPLLAQRDHLSEFALTHSKRLPRVAAVNLGEDSRESNVSV